ncbi:MAG: chromosome partitioning protein [Polaribacter sp.]|jgi:chromosome partitioning protein
MDSSMNIWTIANQKGGVGKTTSVATLAGTLASKGHRVLMIDCDPQASLTAYFGYDSEELGTTLYQWFSRFPKNREEAIVPIVKIGNDVTREKIVIDLVPGCMSLATLDKKFNHKEGMGLAIGKTLKYLESDYDFVLFDCAPVLGVLLINALSACQNLLVPVQTEFLAIKGLERMIQTINMVIKAQHQSIGYTIVPTMFDKRTKASLHAHETMKTKFKENLWSDVIPVDTKFRDASRLNKTPSSLYPDTHGVIAYEALTDLVIEISSRKCVA